LVSQAPGVNVSVLRAKTFGAPNEPISISGRVSLLGIGLPTAVRVTLEGPELNPQTRTFDTLSAPLTGDYSVVVLAEQDGRYVVFARAFLPLGIPIPGGNTIFLGPPLGESSKPPLIIGTPLENGVIIDGRSVPAPALTPIEVSPVISPIFAPVFGAPGRPAVGLPILFGPTGPAGPPAAVEITPMLEELPAAPPPEGEPTRVGGQITGFLI
jgi:hypothetical protein